MLSVDEVSVGGWIAGRLGPFGGWVSSVAPRGFKAYARVLHPVPGAHDANRPNDECFFALWEGYGWIHGSPSVAVLDRTDPIPPAFPAEIINGPRLQHPGRGYILFSGPLMAVLEMGYRTAGWFDPPSPNLFWPADRAWWVATEIDFDSTIVAGSSELIAAVLAEPALEACPVDPEDSLAHDGDTLNT